MKEITFLKQNSEKWEKMEQALENPKLEDPAQMSEIFLELTNDLSYSRTYYPTSATTVYLNGLASKAHQGIYRNKKEEKGRFKTFWKTEVPGLFWRYHKELLVSFLITAIATLIGFVSEVKNDDFVRLILGDGYVNETLQRMKEGNPLGIYGEDGQGSMFFAITINNIKVSFFAFILGMTFSIGTAALLFKNGMMLGAFHAMFYNHGFLVKSLLVVWIHGTLEISSIIIAGAAGFVLGNSYMFPGTYKRIESFKRGALDSLKICIALIPLFICAGFLESFITRYTNMPVWTSLSIIGVSAAFIIFYFIAYPIVLKYKKPIV